MKNNTKCTVVLRVWLGLLLVCAGIAVAGQREGFVSASAKPGGLHKGTSTNTAVHADSVSDPKTQTVDIDSTVSKSADSASDSLVDSTGDSSKTSSADPDTVATRDTATAPAVSVVRDTSGPVQGKTALQPEKPVSIQQKKPMVNRPSLSMPGSALIRRILSSLVALLMLGGAVWIIVALFRGNRDSRRLISTARLGIMDTEVQKACLVVEQGFAEPALDADEVCRRLTSNRAYLESLFQRELSMSVDEFIQQVRVNRVRIFLSNEPSMPMNILASRTGFSSDTDCAACFKKITGTGIEELRKSVAA